MIILRLIVSCSIVLYALVLVEAGVVLAVVSRKRSFPLLDLFEFLNF